MKKFTVITKDGIKWLRPINPHPEKLSTHWAAVDVPYYNPEWQEFEKNNFDAPYLGNRPEGTVISEEQVEQVTQYRPKDTTNADWQTWAGDVIKWDNVIETRAAYTDAESHGRHISDDYWRKRCEAAERYISESPYDPDITNTQEAAYDAWQEIVKQEPK